MESRRDPRIDGIKLESLHGYLRCFGNLFPKRDARQYRDFRVGLRASCTIRTSAAQPSNPDAPPQRKWEKEIDERVAKLYGL